MRIDIGKAGEYQFAAELFKRGYTPHWPSSENIPYDIVYLNRFGAAVRVQVKTTGQKGRVNLNLGINISKKGRKQQDYTKEHVDLIVIWLMDSDTWYLVPVERITRSVAINPTSRKCKWDKYREAWNLLEP